MVERTPIDDPGLDLEAVMREVRSAVEQKRQTGAYSDALLEALAQPLEIEPEPLFASGPRWPEVHATADVQDWERERSSRRLLAGALSVVRRVIGPTVRPLTRRITHNNMVVADVLAEHGRHISRLAIENDRLRRDLASFRKELRGRS